MSLRTAPTTPTTPSGSDISLQTPAKRRSRKQDIKNEVNPDSHFQVQLTSSSGSSPTASAMPSFPTPAHPPLQQQTLNEVGNSRRKSTGGSIPNSKDRPKTKRQPASRKRKSLPADSDNDGSSMSALEELQSKENQVYLEKYILHRCSPSDEPLRYRAVEIQPNREKLQELFAAATDAAAVQHHAEHARYEWIADQPPVIDQSLVGKKFLARTKPWQEELYGVAEVISLTDSGSAKIRFLNEEGVGTQQSRVPAHCLRLYVPIPLIELRMILEAKCNQPDVRRQNGDSDGNDDEVADITERAQRANMPLNSVASRTLPNASSSAQGFNRDRETRTPNRIFRTPSIRTPGPSYPDRSQQFVKGDILCLGNMSRKRYNGSQWRSLCQHSEGCDRESQRGGSCSLHSKGDASRKSSTGEYAPFPTPSTANGSFSQQVTPSKEFNALRPESAREEAAHGLLELSAGGKDKQQRSLASSCSTQDASPMTSIAKPLLFTTNVSPPSGAAQPAVTIGHAAPCSLVNSSVINMVPTSGVQVMPMMPMQYGRYQPPPQFFMQPDGPGVMARQSPRVMLYPGTSPALGTLSTPGGLLQVQPQPPPPPPGSFMQFPGVHAPAALQPAPAGPMPPQYMHPGLMQHTGSGGEYCLPTSLMSSTGTPTLPAVGKVDSLPTPMTASLFNTTGGIGGVSTITPQPNQLYNQAVASSGEPTSQATTTIPQSSESRVPFYRVGISTSAPRQPAKSDGAGTQTALGTCSASSSSQTPPKTPENCEGNKPSVLETVNENQELGPAPNTMRSARRSLFPDNTGQPVLQARIANPSPSSQLGDVWSTVLPEAKGPGYVHAATVTAPIANAVPTAMASSAAHDTGVHREVVDAADESGDQSSQLSNRSCRSRFNDKDDWCANCVTKKNGCSRYKPEHKLARARSRRGKA